MTEITVALLQLAACGNNQDANLAKGMDSCRTAQHMGADIALFPEMWNIGYTGYTSGGGPEDDIWRSPELWAGGPGTDAPAVDRSDNSYLPERRAAWQAQAVSRHSAFVQCFRALAAELHMAIAITYLEEWPGAPRNSVTLFDRHGEQVWTYAKVHTCDFSWGIEEACTPGDGFYTGTLDTRSGPVRVGAMICYDREFPESARVLMLQGAELILNPNASEMEGHRLAQLQTRAYENMVGIALTNYASPDRNGHSIAAHPMAFDDQGRSQNTVVVEAGEAEGLFLAPFNLSELRAYRSRETWGNAFRRPQTYAALTDQRVLPPFVRVDRTGAAWHSTRRHAGSAHAKDLSN